MTARYRFASHLARLTVGGPIRAVAIGSALLVLAVRFLGWGFLAVVFAGAVADFVWCVVRVPERWRAW